MTRPTLHALAAAALAAFAAPAPAADGPLPVRSIAPDSTYALVSADAFARSLERWRACGLHAFLGTDQMRKVLGDDGGAQDAVEERMKELGVPEGSLSWPEAFGVALYTVHDGELDVDTAQALAYGDWGDRADGMAKVFEAHLAETVRKDGVTVEKDDLLGREVQVITVRPPDEERERQGGAFGVEMDMSFAKGIEKLWYCRDGSRFLVASERSGLEDALEAIDGKRQAKLPEQADFRGAMDQLGEQDISMAMLTGPMQRAMAGEGAGTLSLLQPVLQPLFGDVQAWTVGIALDGPRGQVELTSGAFVPGDKAGIWALLGPEAPPGAPPAMVGPDAIGVGRLNVRFDQVMNLLNTVVANLPEEEADEIDASLVQFGPMLGKAFEALGPAVWVYETVRQPVTPESRVTGTVIACSNPKAVVPMVTQFGGSMGLEPREVDGNTLFSADFLPIAIGVSNGFVASGDQKLVEQAMRSLGQSGLPSVTENKAYSQALAAIGAEPAVAWGFIDVAARWSVERELLERFGEDDSRLDNAMGRADDSVLAKRLGYRLPGNTNDVLKTIDADMVNRHMGPVTWTMVGGPKGFVTRATLLRPAAPAQ
jgi:hypothetical protein